MASAGGLSIHASDRSTRLAHRFAVSVFCAIAAMSGACGNINEPRKVGYFKDDVGNRILSFEMTSTTTADDAKASALSLGYTPGQMTAAYYYPKGSTIPADGLTLARTVAAANRVLYETPGLGQWRFVYMRGLNGTEEFHDCVETPADGLCRRRREGR